MPNTNTQLGGRLPLLEPAALAATQKALYDRIEHTVVPLATDAGFRARLEDGRLIGPFNAMLFSPAICGNFLSFQHEEEMHTALGKRLRQVVILTVGSVWNASYELYAHSAVAGKVGLPADAINALAQGRAWAGLSDAETAAQRFTLQLTAERHVDDATYASANAALGAKGLVDLIALAGCYQVVCSLLTAFEIPAPGPASEMGPQSPGALT